MGWVLGVTLFLNGLADLALGAKLDGRIADAATAATLQARTAPAVAACFLTDLSYNQSYVEYVAASAADQNRIGGLSGLTYPQMPATYETPGIPYMLINRDAAWQRFNALRSSFITTNQIANNFADDFHDLETVRAAYIQGLLRADRFNMQAGVRFAPTTCPTCAPVPDAYWNADNRLETVVALTVPRRRTLELGFDGAAANVRRVLLESGEIGFRREDGRLIVALPPLDHDAITAGEVATHIVEPGMVLRFKHADPARRAGSYATGAFPTLQRDAANTLEFAQREVVRRLKLGEDVERRGIGRIQIMGFDTNAPHGHVDAPPHMHMHLRWPGDAGTQVGHYYIGANGLLTHNMVGIKGMNTPDRRFDRGQTFVTIGADDHPVYSHRITEQGWLEIGRPGEAACVIAPLGLRGFADGAHVRCPGMADAPITVRDDLARGVLTVTTGSVVETFRYATDNGELLSPVAPPAAAPSVPPAD